MTPPVAGADGCRGGWIVAVLEAAGEPAADGEPSTADGPTADGEPSTADGPTADGEPSTADGPTAHAGPAAEGAGPGPPAATGAGAGPRDGPSARTVRRGRLTLAVVDRIGPVVAEVGRGRLAALAVDMPIGLPAGGPRACDRAARRRLGARRASVFPAPVRDTLGAGSYAEAGARSRAAAGVGLPVQAFHLLAPIAELDAAVDPALQDRVVEAHPELAFARLAGAPAVHPKRSAPGRRERAVLLAAAGLGDLGDVRLPGAATHDVLDAAVLALTAERVRDGSVERLGDGARDARGLRMEIVV